MPEAHLKPCYMLEPPKAQGATKAKILADEAKAEMDNQQITQIELGWLAGIIDGEGYIGVSMYRNHSNTATKSVKVEINVCNTDEEIIKKYVNILRKIEVKPFVSKKNHKGVKKPVFRAMVHRMAKCSRLLKVVLPHLTGTKKERAILIAEFLESRLSNHVKGIAIPYSQKEMRLMESCLSLQKRGISETIRKAELALSQSIWEDKIGKRLEKMSKAIKLKLSGEYSNRQIADMVGYKSPAAVSILIKRYFQNELGLQKAGLLPLSDDIVRPYVKA